jgi:hypothetical protein
VCWAPQSVVNLIFIRWGWPYPQGVETPFKLRQNVSRSVSDPTKSAKPTPESARPVSTGSECCFRVENRESWLSRLSRFGPVNSG